MKTTNNGVGDIMKKCMSSTMLGERAYTLKDIEFNENIRISKLRNEAEICCQLY